RHARLILVVFAYVKLDQAKPQLLGKLARREARVDQLRRQRQAIGGVLADGRQAHLRQMNRGKTFVAAQCFATRRSDLTTACETFSP
ncbi:MAG: hypothetical protein M3Z96_13870, partial [Pseudomonadota bacterium]|nr:hypothetical protein [Pseudomonadota bacterium]